MLCFRKSPLAKKFMVKRGGGSIKNFPWEICYVMLPKLLVVESFDVSSISGVMSRPSTEYIFVSQYRKIL